VEFRDEGHSAEVERRRIDQDGPGLPLLGGQACRVGHGCDLGRQGLLWVDLAVDDNDPLDLLAGQASICAKCSSVSG
jgi:hypothetical protein